MSVRVYRQDYRPLKSEELDNWRSIGAAETSDCLERAQALTGAISPLDSTMRIVGHARTVGCMVADNSALHAALEVAQPGEVLVADAQAFVDAAVWGGLMTRAALAKGIAGLVIDGAVRDSDEIVELGFPCFVRARTPRGPHKGFGGKIGAPISCGGVAVETGDLVIADADGVTVVPFSRIAETYKAARALQEKEAAAIDEISKGGSLAEIYGIPETVEVTP